MSDKLTLYHAPISSASWRVRWGLALKKLSYQSVEIDLLKKEHRSESFLKINPMAQVPALAIGGKVISESLAILEWLDDRYPSAPFRPKDAFDRARVSQLTLLIAAGVQPLQALSVLDYHSSDTATRANYARHWIEIGFRAYEKLVGETKGKFSFGDTITTADLVLVPQALNARRYGIDLGAFPQIDSIYKECLATTECASTSPNGLAQRG